MNRPTTASSIFQRSLRDQIESEDAADPLLDAGDLNRDFPDHDACLEFIKEKRWPNSVTKCRKCNQERKHSRVTGRAAYACNHCGNHLYPLKETLFARSSTSLKTWFYVMRLLACTQEGVTAKRIQRETGVTYKTAWRMLSRIRESIVILKPESKQSTKERIVLVRRG